MEKTKNTAFSPQKCETIAVRIVWALSAAFMAFLCVNSMFSTGRLEPGGSEVLAYTTDHKLRMLVIAALAVAFFMLLEKVLDKVPTKVMGNAVTLFFLAASLILVFGGKCCPVADQNTVMGLAARWNAGDFSFLQEEYTQLYPHQLGLAAYMMLQARLVGNNNYLFFQLLNCFWLAGAVQALYRSVDLLFESRRLTNTALLLLMPCAPLIFYAAFTYGEIPSLALGAMAVYFQIYALKKQKEKFLLLAAVCIAAAVLLRKNTMILLIAMVLVQLVYALGKKQWRTAAWVLALIVFTAAGQYSVKAVCNQNGSYTVPKGVSATTWIAMGMQEDDTMCGAFNGYTYHVSRAENMNTDAIAADAKQQIGVEWAKMTNDPGYMAHFYYSKLMQQWNEPTFNMFVMTHDTEGRPAWLNDLWYGAGYGIVYSAMNYYQFVIYLFVLVEMLLQLRRPDTLKMTFSLYFVGGFLFSILWEAKARYMLAYYVFLIPLAGAGLYHAAKAAKQGLQRFKARKAQGSSADTVQNQTPTQQ
jgi:hypothetical protein